MTPALGHRDRFYDILADLKDRIGVHTLAECHGRLAWPKRGVYFFFEPGEVRADGVTPRVVRVGTHAVSAGSKTTLWKRLAQHRGTLAGGGNHRGSVFRLHVGTALLNRGDVTLSSNTWSNGSSVPKAMREAEQPLEQAVSDYIKSMPFLWVDADDEPRKTSIRATLERNSIGLLSRLGADGASADPASDRWLGHYADRVTVRKSNMWNVRETSGGFDPAFLDRLEECAKRTRPLGG